MATRPKAGEVETRDLALEADDRKIRGKIPYGVESRDMGGWREVIEPGALSATRLDDLVATVDHAGLPLGRYPGTLEVEDRADGMHWAVTPPESRADVREAVQRGDLRGGSWRMRVAKDEWRGDVRHVLAIDELRDVSVVTTGAYGADDAPVEFRSAANDDGKEKVMAEQEEQVEKVEDRGVEVRDAGSLRVEQRNELPTFTSLADAFASAGFFESRTASIGFDEFRNIVWSGGTSFVDMNPRREGQPALGYDQRWLYPVLPTTAVDSATTSIQYLRQAGRVLAGTAVIRALDATSTKPSVGGTIEYTTATMQQVAAIHPDVPRIIQMQPLFQSVIETDLRLSINDGLDEVARRGITTAGTAAGVTGTDVLQKARKAMTVIQAQGYNPDVLAIDPAGAEQLDLLQSSGSEKFYLYGPGRSVPTGPFGLTMRIWKNAGTALLDTSAFGRMYISPVQLASFEQDAGQTNRQTYRMETTATYTVERLSAGLKII